MDIAAEVAVVGLGAMGAATLYQLARRGVDAVGIDRFAPPHALGSTHGETRITREAVGEGADYVPLVRRSHAIWRELEAATGATLMVACGGAVIGDVHGTVHRSQGFLATTIALAERFGIAHEILDRAALAERFPQFTGLTGQEVAYHEPGAGYLIPEACVKAQLGEARRLGAAMLTNTTVLSVTEDGGRVRIETTAGAVTAARAVVAAGAWTAPLLGAPFDRLLRVTRQVLHWFKPEDPELYAADRPCPVYIRVFGSGDEDYFYGFPIPAGGGGVKVATERLGDVADPDAAVVASADLAADGEALFRSHIAGRLAGMTPTLLKSAACFYTGTAGSRFIVDSHPAMPRVTVVSACSGHGFKHSAAIGEAVAERLRSALVLRPFRL